MTSRLCQFQFTYKDIQLQATFINWDRSLLIAISDSESRGQMGDLVFGNAGGTSTLCQDEDLNLAASLAAVQSQKLGVPVLATCKIDRFSLEKHEDLVPFIHSKINEFVESILNSKDLFKDNKAN